MKTTNQAFVDAYRQASRPANANADMKAEPVARIAPVASPLPSWQNTEIATWHLPSDGPTSEGPATEGPATDVATHEATSWTRIDAAHVEAPHFETPQAKRVRRRLSEIAAERFRHESRPKDDAVAKKIASTASGELVWPEICADLLAEAAPQYDGALRNLVAAHPESLVLAIVATRPKLGCTTTAMCLALRAATLGMRPLLLEASDSHLGQQLGMSADNGWWQLATRRDSPLRAIRFDARSGVAVLPTGAPLPAQVDSATMFELGSICGTLRQKHRAIVVDLGVITSPTESARAGRLLSAIGVDSILALAPAGDEAGVVSLRSNLATHASQLAGVLGVVQSRS